MTHDAFAVPAALPAVPADFAVVRERRTHLGGAIRELESALAAPLPGRSAAWADMVLAALRSLQQALDVHVAHTEGDGGLFAQVRNDAPRLDSAVRALMREHTQIATALDGPVELLAARADDEAALQRARDLLTAVLAQLSRHRQPGADLLYEAYSVDIGGE